MPSGRGTGEERRARTPSRDTKELLDILERSRSLTSAMRALDRDMCAPGFAERLDELMRERDLNATQLSETALLSRSFTYQLCSGERMPSRDIVLRLALVLELSVEQTQSFLRTAQRGALYPRVARDAVIIFALRNRMGILDTDEQLQSMGLAGIL